jgi:transcriptional regulator with XRE-family HTH domain
VDAKDARTVGRRLREIRYWRGKSLRVVAELAGITGVPPVRLERGERPLDRRSRLDALVTAIQVTPSEITGQPYPPSNESEAASRLRWMAPRTGEGPDAGGRRGTRPPWGDEGRRTSWSCSQARSWGHVDHLTPMGTFGSMTRAE